MHFLPRPSLALALLPLAAAAKTLRSCRPQCVPEACNRASIAKSTSVSLDMQGFVHPGYNADRGPVSVFGVRLHWES